jgi:hypothetical protein
VAEKRTAVGIVKAKLAVPIFAIPTTTVAEKLPSPVGLHKEIFDQQIRSKADKL